MPYADPGRQRAAVRDSMRRSRQRKASVKPLDQPTAADLGNVLWSRITAIHEAHPLDDVEVARALASVITTALRACEQGDLLARLEAIEARLETTN